MTSAALKIAVTAACLVALCAPPLMAQDTASSSSSGLDDFTRAQANQALQCVGVYDLQISQAAGDDKRIADLTQLRHYADLAFLDYADATEDDTVALYPQEDKMVADNIAAGNGDLTELSGACDQLYKGSDQ